LVLLEVLKDEGAETTAEFRQEVFQVGAVNGFAGYCGTSLKEEDDGGTGLVVMC
jgi:hypothetical protein